MVCFNFMGSSKLTVKSFFFFLLGWHLACLYFFLTKQVRSGWPPCLKCQHEISEREAHSRLRLPNDLSLSKFCVDTKQNEVIIYFLLNPSQCFSTLFFVSRHIFSVGNTMKKNNTIMKLFYSPIKTI